MELAIEEAIHAAAPDIERIDAEGAAEPAPPPLLQIEITPGARRNGSDPAHRGRAWSRTGALPELAEGAMLLRDVGGEPVLFLRLDARRLYAYRSSCPRCAASLDAGALAAAELTCPSCGTRYDVHRAGRCLDDAALHLDPLPLLADGEGVKVAVGTV
jgi:nitrite reductase/ring-hydroxylating ferredoxin subunit